MPQPHISTVAGDAPALAQSDSAAAGADAASMPPAPRRSGPLRWIRLPRGVTWKRVRWPAAASIAAVHAAAILAVFPSLFSWTGLILALAGVYIFGTLGINICYHRLLTHRSFKTPKWFERFLSLLAMCCLEGSPIAWVANHRMHHQHSDKEPDPHSPLVAFLWSHVGWMLVENRGVDSPGAYWRYARDLCKDRFYRVLSRRQRWLLIFVGHALLFYLAGFAVGTASSGAVEAGLWLGLSWIVWGIFVRTVVVWHITWSVNSLTHLAGYRNYETSENSRNNWLVGVLAMGEGWHNNHHADQRSAAHGHRWWEIDMTYLTILLFKKVGLAWNVIQPKRTPGTTPVPPPLRASR